jgi:hypothetical protein
MVFAILIVVTLTVVMGLAALARDDCTSRATLAKIDGSAMAGEAIGEAIGIALRAAMADAERLDEGWQGDRLHDLIGYKGRPTGSPFRRSFRRSTRGFLA